MEFSFFSIYSFFPVLKHNPPPSWACCSVESWYFGNVDRMVSGITCVCYFTSNYFFFIKFTNHSFSAAGISRYFFLSSLLFGASGWTQKWISIMLKVWLSICCAYISVKKWFFIVTHTKQCRVLCSWEWFLLAQRLACYSNKPCA